MQGGGSTDAWADAFVPDEGWIEFDPTKRITAGSDLIRVATTRKPSQASPISGSFESDCAICLDLNVSVEVGDVEAPSWPVSGIRSTLGRRPKGTEPGA